LVSNEVGIAQNVEMSAFCMAKDVFQFLFIGLSHTEGAAATVQLLQQKNCNSQPVGVVTPYQPSWAWDRNCWTKQFSIQLVPFWSDISKCELDRESFSNRQVSQDH